MTVKDWRKKLGLPSRFLGRELGGSTDWRDEPLKYRVKLEPKGGYAVREQSPKKILETLADKLSFAPGDIQAVISRTMRIIQLKSYRGRSISDLLLVQAFLYNRSSVAGRPPIGIHKFVRTCNEAGFYVELAPFQTLARRLASPTSQEPGAVERIRRQEYLLIKLGMQKQTIEKAIKVAGNAGKGIKSIGRTATPLSLAASSVLLAAKSNGESLTQREISNHFGISEVTLRNVARLLMGMSDVRDVLGPVGEAGANA
jgi:hypothetical protein